MHFIGHFHERRAFHSINMIRKCYICYDSRCIQLSMDEIHLHGFIDTKKSLAICNLVPKSIVRLRINGPFLVAYTMRFRNGKRLEFSKAFETCL